MKLRFISASYTNNTYNPYEFWRYVPHPGLWVMQNGTEVEYNFTADDGIASLIVNNTDMDYRGKTHMLVPTLNKVYEISGYEYENNKQTKLILVEDAFIASYPHLASLTRKIEISRSNTPNTFKGAHNIPQVALEYETTIVGSVNSPFAKWLLVSFEAGGGTVSLPFVHVNPLAVDTRYETFDTLALLISTYPEVATTRPAMVSYFGRMCHVTGETFARQCVYDGDNVRWVPATMGPYGSSVTTPVTVNIGSISGNTRLNMADVPTITVMLPFNTCIKAMNANGGVTTPTRLASAYNFLEAMALPGVTLTSRIVAMRIVDEEMLKGFFYNGHSGNDTLLVTTSMMTTFNDAFSTPYAVITPDVFDYDRAVGISVASDSITDYEPYAEYTLSVFGNYIPINRKYINSNLRLRTSMSSTNIVFTLYNGTLDNVIHKGSIVTNVLYSVDKFGEFLAQNSEYYKVKGVNIASSLVSRVGTGVISGSMTGNPVGSVAGGVAGLVSAGQEIANMYLNEQSMKNAPDSVRGDASNVDIVLNGLFGIYLIKRSPTAPYKAMLDNMYRIQGHPTNVVDTLSNLTPYSDTVLGKNTKLIVGQVRETIRNLYVTNVVNEKLAQGVIFVYEP